MNHKLKTVDTFTAYDKRMAQKKILKIVAEVVAEVPEYKDTRFQKGFDNIEGTNVKNGDLLFGRLK